MREIGAFEAKNKLGQLLDLVEAGQEIVITVGDEGDQRSRA
jgi:prevent-host-death family protein